MPIRLSVSLYQLYTAGLNRGTVGKEFRVVKDSRANESSDYIPYENMVKEDGGSSVGRARDLWSVGCVFHRLPERTLSTGCVYVSIYDGLR